MDPFVRWAQDESERLLSCLPGRWQHVEGVARRASWTAPALPAAERPVLMAAAYVHDIGYAQDLQRTGLHQLDGALYLRALGQERLARLVAHHSEARFEIVLSGHGSELATFPREESATAAALTYCDLTTGPDGDAVAFSERLREVYRRYGEGDVSRALQLATPSLASAVRATERRLRAVGLVVS